MKRPLSAAQLATAVESFNAKYPVGTEVTYTAIEGIPSTAIQTKTRSVAWVMSGHSAMVMVEDVSGGVEISHVTKRIP